MPIRGLRIAVVPPRPLSRRLDQGAEETLVACHFWMPLDAERKPLRRIFHRFEVSVLGPTGPRERAGVGDALMVVAADSQIVTHQFGDAAARGEPGLQLAIDGA